MWRCRSCEDDWVVVAQVPGCAAADSKLVLAKGLKDLKDVDFGFKGLGRPGYVL